MAVHYLNMIGEICPHPLVTAKAKMETMVAGDSLIIDSDFSRSVRNILAWADNSGYVYDVEEVENGIWQVKITKV